MSDSRPQGRQGGAQGGVKVAAEGVEVLVGSGCLTRFGAAGDADGHGAGRVDIGDGSDAGCSEQRRARTPSWRHRRNPHLIDPLQPGRFHQLETVAQAEGVPLQDRPGQVEERVALVRPTKARRASGSGCGVRSPVR